ncbi:Aluminum-activated malate transporter [Thalictrum thalictroides]|uniref:Aluminum-activated malate transporter n=1 Tax=Thalictrum thalictroides TaxID=46969 RepID=A0A7J6W3Z8_THATH|nr:Aluminum-activated malate transporter [Thalictrum thalictroides]
MLDIYFILLLTVMIKNRDFIMMMMMYKTIMMVNNKAVSGGLEWRVRVADGSSSAVLVPESGIFERIWQGIIGLVFGIIRKVRNFFAKAWDVGVDDPRKIMHCLKVGVALTVVSLFYYMRPLYQGVGGNAMWAVLTVVVIFEYTVGATLCKSLNRATGTFLAGALAVGVHWVASQSGERFEPIILRSSVFILATSATFSRFIPVVKARFDYGAMIFILTFSLVAISGYRVDNLFNLAQERLSTIVIGGSMCLLVSMFICPIWAGQDLHFLVARNMEKMANSLDGCVAEYFKDSESDEESRKNFQGYKCVLNSKATEEALANFARWEPAHGNFSFRHPWKQYLKIGASLRSCAYCIEALNGCINSEILAPEFIKEHLSGVSTRLASHSSTVLKELAHITKTMRRSSTLDFAIEDMKSAVEDLHDALKSLPSQLEVDEKKTDPITQPTSIPLIEVLPLITASSLMVEITTRIERTIVVVNELASLAKFKPVKDKKTKQSKVTNKNRPDQGQDTIKTLQMV